MSEIQITRPHQLSQDAARARVSRLAEQLQSSLAVSCRWEGDTLLFSRTGASGAVVLLADSVEVRIKLGTLLRPLRGKVEQTVIAYLDEDLGPA